MSSADLRICGNTKEWLADRMQFLDADQKCTIRLRDGNACGVLLNDHPLGLFRFFSPFVFHQFFARFFRFFPCLFVFGVFFFLFLISFLIVIFVPRF